MPKLPRTYITAVGVVGAIVLAALGSIDGSEALAFLAGALGIPSGAEVARETRAANNKTREGGRQ